MFQLEPVHDLLARRSAIFNFIPYMAKLGLREDILHEDIEFALSVCANFPSFKFEGKLPAATVIGNIVYDPRQKFALPFDCFSFVTNGIEGSVSDESVNYSKRITVIARSDLPDADSVLVATFVLAKEKHQWVPLIPLRYGLVIIDGIPSLKKYLVLKPGVTNEMFEQKCDSTYEVGFLRSSHADLLYYFTTILTLLNSKTTISYREAHSVGSLHAAAKAKKSFWEYHVVELGTKNSPVPYQGGHHASPKQHERIGHWRYYKSGKKVFIETTTVGKLENGRIEKDYGVTK